MISSSTFVPLSTGFYHAPHLRFKGKIIDIGAFAESLIYYDRVIVDIVDDDELISLVGWFRKQGKLNDFLALLNDGTLTLFYKSFMSGAAMIERTGNYGVWNFEQPKHKEVNAFENIVLASDKLAVEVRQAKRRNQLIKAASDGCIEVKAEKFSAAIDNARLDYSTPQGCAFLLQIFLDEVYQDLGYHVAPPIHAVIKDKGERKTITWNFDFAVIDRYLRDRNLPLNFDVAMPLNGALVGAQALWSAALLECDLYCAAPLTSYAEFKIEQGGQCVRTGQIIDQLVAEVAFPDVRALVNSGKLGFERVMELRKEASRFRQWLQEESELDRNAVLAYHQEIAKQAGWMQHLGNVLSITGRIGGAALGAVVGGAVAGPSGSVEGAVAGAAAAEGISFLFDLGNKLNEGWKPAIFGELADKTIKEALQKDPLIK